MSVGGGTTPNKTPRTKKADGGAPRQLKIHFLIQNLNKMNSYAIISGTFTAAGNFSGYTAMGKRVHIFKRQMQALGLTADADVKFPLYAIAEIKTISKLDANRNPVVDEQGNPVTDQRLTATAVFADKAAITEACVEESTLTAEIKDSIAKAASSKGLTQSVVDQLVAAF